MAGIVFYTCDNCGSRGGLYWCGEVATMIKNHNGVSKNEYLCSECGDKSVYYKKTERKCPKCGCNQLVGHNSEKCPKCKTGKMIREEFDVAFKIK